MRSLRADDIGGQEEGEVMTCELWRDQIGGYVDGELAAR
jgi:hypothetical protein